MGSFIAKALGSLLKDEHELAECARSVASVVAFRRHRREAVTNMTTGERMFRYVIDFETAEQVEAFDTAIRRAIDHVSRGES